jgi:hypothetical protein
MMRAFDIMPMRTSLASKLKAQPHQSVTNFLAGQIARQFHAGTVRTGSFTKCNRMGQCRCGSSGSKRQFTRSRIIGARRLRRFDVKLQIGPLFDTEASVNARVEAA